MPLGENIHLNWGAMIQPALQAFVGDSGGFTGPHYVHRITGIKTARPAGEPRRGRCELGIRQMNRAAADSAVSLGPDLP